MDLREVKKVLDVCRIIHLALYTLRDGCKEFDLSIEKDLCEAINEEAEEFEDLEITFYPASLNNRRIGISVRLTNEFFISAVNYRTDSTVIPTQHILYDDLCKQVAEQYSMLLKAETYLETLEVIRPDLERLEDEVDDLMAKATLVRTKAAQLRESVNFFSRDEYQALKNKFPSLFIE